MLEPLDMTDWTMLACPHCGWHWHSVPALARHVETIHGAPRAVALAHAEQIALYVSRLHRTLERAAGAGPAPKSQVSEVKRPRRIAS